MMDNNFRLISLVKSDNNVALVRELLPNNDNADDRDHYRQTLQRLLRLATMSKEDNPEIVQLLIDEGADVRQRNGQSNSPLHLAVMHRKRKVVDLLLKTDIDINCMNRDGMTSLQCAVYMCDYMNQDPYFKPPDMWIIEKLLDHPLINVNEADFDGETALVFAITEKQLEIVKVLLKKNASLDTSDVHNGYTPLHVALRLSDPYIIVALLLKTANVVRTDKNGESPLDFIIKKTSVESVDLAKVYLKVIAFNYDLKEVLESKIQSLELSQLLKRCWNEISRMKGDIIDKNLSVFDFFSNNPVESGFDDPIMQIYKPVIQRLINGLYPEYFFYILNRITKSKLIGVLESIIKQEYCNIESDAVKNMQNYLAVFLQIVMLGLLNKYLSCLDIFILIAAISSIDNSEYVLDYCYHECYLTDLWDQYSDEHFK